ncbi:hypothetical protein L596_028775 [Steinernema carpocapsae]|uniref:Uncharacterized protein n=1 Tax=Steinernema carpocapsae TaxID=34508 RepID=A0A4V5ZXZ6_STECR|nr:hypothetical protein L596_028775 [Steinernema carpocapsae]
MKKSKSVINFSSSVKKFQRVQKRNCLNTNFTMKNTCTKMAPAPINSINPKMRTIHFFRSLIFGPKHTPAGTRPLAPWRFSQWR